MVISKGKVNKGVKFLVYGPEGIGKSTFVSKIPGIVFIDTEGSTSELDVSRLPVPTSWQMLLDEVDYAASHVSEVPALVIDTGDWAERLCLDHVLNTHPVNGQPMKSIEDAGYGKGYVYLYEEFGKLLNKMLAMSDHGQHVGFTAHAMMRKFELPDELGSYDRWELKMSKKVAPLLKEWSSLMLFANYKTMVYAVDDKGKKHKASGGQRVMYTSHHPCWDAKNRFDLPEEMSFDYSAVAHLFTVNNGIVSSDVSQQNNASVNVSVNNVDSDISNVNAVAENVSAPAVSHNGSDSIDYSGVPSELVDLMKNDHISPLEVKAAIASKGYFPIDTPFENYPIDFVKGVLIGAWPQVRDLCFKMRENDPF